MKKVLVQCDFDGTVTVEDISFMLLDAFANGDWRAVNRQYAEGKITVGQFNEQAFAMVKTGKKTMLEYIKNRAVLRKGFRDFADFCKGKNFRLVIVSNGLDFYIEQIFKDNGLRDIEFHAAETRFLPQGLKVRYVGPDGNVVDREFKDKYAKSYLDEGYNVVYIGNGTSDLSAARLSHHIFATESLLRNCRQHNVTCTSFTDFTDIISMLRPW
ncbi:MAG: MtnX-like HAD-IB family phosphatase [Dehalococcoidales bacterium]|nr:MtnX-like HAD-IB family phosphatase [Dehalococcoidales bacterium]